MLRKSLILVGILLLSSTTAAGMHSDATLPLLAEDGRTEDALDWLKQLANEEGCAFHTCEGDPTANKWWSMTLAHAGIDPMAWPRPEGSVLQWLLDNADDLEEPSEREQCSRPHQFHQCQASRVHSAAKSILAFRAGGLDPSAIPLPGGGQRDFVDELFSMFQAGQFGFPGYANDNIFAIIALNSIEYDGSELQQAIAYVEASQDSNGGVGWADGIPPSVDMTAAALMALGPHNRTPFTENALGFLKDNQFRSGEQKGCWPGISGNPTAGSTGWALQGLIAASEDPLDWGVNGRSPIDCLLDFQNPDGGFANSKRSGQDASNPAATQQAIAALSWVPYGASRGPTEAINLETVIRPQIDHPLTPSQGFLRIHGQAQDTITVSSTSEGAITHHGFQWGTFRPIEWVLETAGLPARPLIDTPHSIGHLHPFQVNLAPDDVWTQGLFLRLPSGEVAAGATHNIQLPGPDTHTLEAWGTNRIGEPGLIQKTKIEVPYGALAQVEFNQTSPTTPAGEAINFSAQPKDAYGNPRPDSVSYQIERGPGTIDPVSGHYISMKEGTAIIGAHATDHTTGTTIKSTVAIQVLSPTDAEFTWGCEDKECTFKADLNQEMMEKSPQITWHFGDGHSDQGATVTHQYVEYGNYAVGLNVTDSNGVSSESTHNITVAPPAPSMSLKIVVTPTSPKIGETVDITARIMNKGTGPLEESEIWFETDKNRFHKESLPTIASNQEWDATAQWRFSEEQHDVRITIPEHTSVQVSLRANTEGMDDNPEGTPSSKPETQEETVEKTPFRSSEDDKRATPGFLFTISILAIFVWIVKRRYM